MVDLKTCHWKLFNCKWQSQVSDRDIFVGICLIIVYDFCCVDDGVEEETQADNLELGLFNNSGAYIFFNTTG